MSLQKAKSPWAQIHDFVFCRMDGLHPAGSSRIKQGDTLQNMKSRIHLSERFTYSKMLAFALPSVLMNIFTSLYIVVDGFFVARFVGRTEFAAVSMILPALNIPGTVGYMFGVGGSALIAKRLGERNQKKADSLFSLLVLFSAALGFLLMVPGFIFMRPLSTLLGAEGKLLENCVLYGRIFILVLPAWILAYAFQLFFVTAEKPRLGLAFTLCAGFCNAVLDALFILGFGWGLAGAAFASALSQIVGGVFPVIYFARKNDSLLKLVKPVWDGRSLMKSCINGTSEFMSEVSMSLVGIIYNIQLLKYAGEDGVAIYGVLLYVSLIFSAMFVGYSNGIGPVISFHYGAQDHEELKGLRKKSLRIIGLTSVLMVILSEALAHPVSSLYFQNAGALLETAVHAFRIFSAAYLFMGLAIFSSSLFTALGNGEISALISFLRTLVFELGAVVLLPGLLGLDGIWASAVFAELMAAVVGSIFMAALQRKYHY